MSPARLVVIPQHFGALVFERPWSGYAAFDHEAAALLSAAVTTPVDQLVARVEDAEQREATAGFVEHYRSRGYFEGDLLDGEVLPVEPPRRHLVGPLTVHLEVTDRCQLDCAHCFAEREGQGDLLSLEELERLFAEMASMGSFRLGLTGGEPLLRPDLLQIIDAALARGLVPCLTTNGLDLTEELARALGRRRLGWLNVSLDGATPETHEALRGPGTFDRALAGIRLLAPYAEISVAMTLTTLNAHEVAGVCRLARNQGARAVVFRPLYPVGRAAARGDLMPTFSCYMDALERAGEEAAALKMEMCTVHPWGPGSRLETRSVIHDNFGCGAANTVCSISCRGDVSPCSFLGGDHVAGNLRRTSLAVCAISNTFG